MNAEKNDFIYLSEKELNLGFYITVPKEIYTSSLYRELSNDAILLYGILLDRFTLSKLNNVRDKEGRIFIIASLENIMKILNVSRGKARSTLKELQEINLLKIERMAGFNSKRRIYLGKLNYLDDPNERCKKSTIDNTKFVPSKVQNLYPNKPNINKYKNDNKAYNSEFNYSYLQEFDFED